MTSLGHAHPGLTAAIVDQAATLLHTSNLYYHPFQAEAAARLTQLSGLSRAFFCNSGTEAVEACLKFARRYWHTQGATDRKEFVAIEGGFSGRTLGALSVTHDEHYRAPFAPLLGPVTFVNPADPEALLRAVSTHTAAIIAEPIQGEGGIRPMSQAFAHAINEACRDTGTLYIADEVQTGRDGRPSVLCSALGLTPISSRSARLRLRRARRRRARVGGDRSGHFSRRPWQHVWRHLLATRAAAFFLEKLMDHGCSTTKGA